jgi:HAMP domain-containing protein
MELMVRRRPEVSVDAASRDLSNAYVRSWNNERQFFPRLAPSDVAKPVAIAGPLKTSAGPDASLEARTALWVTGVTLIVLLIACANVANLFLGRALRRRREVALRLALGVSRGRLAAQTMTESLVLSLVGCSSGIVVAQLGGMALSRLFLPSGQSFSLIGDWRTLAVAVGAALFAAVLTGVVPAMLATKADLAGALKAGGEGGDLPSFAHAHHAAGRAGRAVRSCCSLAPDSSCAASAAFVKCGSVTMRIVSSWCDRSCEGRCRMTAGAPR